MKENGREAPGPCQQEHVNVLIHLSNTLKDQLKSGLTLLDNCVSQLTQAKWILINVERTMEDVYTDCPTCDGPPKKASVLPMVSGHTGGRGRSRGASTQDSHNLIDDRSEVASSSRKKLKPDVRSGIGIIATGGIPASSFVGGNDVSVNLVDIGHLLEGRVSIKGAELTAFTGEPVSEPTKFSSSTVLEIVDKKRKFDTSDDEGDSTSVKKKTDDQSGYVRLVRATLALGDVKACQTALDEAASKPELSIDFTEEIKKLDGLIKLKKEIELSQAKKDYRKILYLTDRAKEIAVGDHMLKVTKAESMIKLGQFTEAHEQCTEILQADGAPSMDACLLMAYCFYQGDNLDKSLQYYRQALTLAPDNQTAASYHEKIKQIQELREVGTQMFKLQRWDETQDAYQKCLNIVALDEQGNTILESKLNFNLALVTNKNDMDISLTYVNKAIELNPQYVKAILHRASISLKQEKFEEALKDLENAEKLDPKITDIRRMIENTRLAAKQAKRKDYYKILEIDKQASSDEIKKAYKKRALVHHPDRHANASETERKDQERTFQEVLEAYEILLDDEKRRWYDSGLDVQKISTNF